MGAWYRCGKPIRYYSGTSMLQTLDNDVSADPALGNATFPEYMSVLRNAWDTDNETALWFQNGDFYNDHATTTTATSSCTRWGRRSPSTGGASTLRALTALTITTVSCSNANSRRVECGQPGGERPG